MLKPKEARTSQRYCQHIQSDFWIILSFQGKGGQSDPLECHRLRSIDILGIRDLCQRFLALQVTHSLIQIRYDPPAFPSFVEVSGVHGPRHGLRWFSRWLQPKWWHWMHKVWSGLGLREERHGKDNCKSQCGPALRTVPGRSKNLQCHRHRDVAGLLGKKKLWSKRTLYRFLR